MAGCSHISEITVDTKGLCLLCLKPCSALEPTSLSSQHGLKQLLSYLQVNVYELFNCSPGFTELMDLKESRSVKATLCSGCSSVTEEFNRWYQEYEKILVHFDNCVQSVHRLINDGDQKPERVQEYVARMRSETTREMFNANFVHNLRSEAVKKCALKIEERSTNVMLKPVNVIVTESESLPTSDNRDVNLHPDGDKEPQQSTNRAVDNNPSGLLASPKKALNRKKFFQSFNAETSRMDRAIKSDIPFSLNRDHTIIRNRLSCTCSICLKTCPSKLDLLRHMKTHTNSKDRNKCLFCNYVGTNTLALKHHRIDNHLIQMVKDSLECSLPDFECGQAIDSIYNEMIQADNSCFKCNLKFTRRTINLKRHAVGAHFKDFLQLVKNRVKNSNNNDERDHPLLDYLGLTRRLPDEATTDTATEEVEDDITPSSDSDDPKPGCSKNLIYATRPAVRRPSTPTLASLVSGAPQSGPIVPVMHELKKMKLILIPLEHLQTQLNQNGSNTQPDPDAVPEVSPAVPAPAKRQFETSKNESPERGLAKRSRQTLKMDMKALTKGKPELSADKITCEKCSQEFTQGRCFNKHLPFCRGPPKPPSSKIVQCPSPHQKIKKLFTFAQDQDDKFHCPVCSYQSVALTSITGHVTFKHFPVLIHQTLESSTTLESCSSVVSTILKEMGAEGGDKKKCFKCAFSTDNLCMLKEHLVGKHFEQLVQEVEGRLEELGKKD